MAQPRDARVRPAPTSSRPTAHPTGRVEDGRLAAGHALGAPIAKFGARQGWTSLVVDRETDWKVVRSLLQTSYRRNASQRLIREFERVGEASRRPE